MTRGNSIIYVGNLPLNIRESELDKLFFSFGRIKKIDLKVPVRPPAYAFIEYEDSRDAEDAVQERDGYGFAGEKLRVEFCHGGRSSGPPSRPRHGDPRGGGRERYADPYEEPYDRPRREKRDRGDRGDRSDRGDRGDRRESRREQYPRSNGLGPSPFGPSRKTSYRVFISGLPQSCSWQDLKDHMRKGGEVTFADTYSDRSGVKGVVDYATYEDMKYAIRKLDGTQFANPFHKNSIKVREAETRSVSPSRRRSYSRSGSRSPLSDSRSRSRSRSQLSRSRSRSPLSDSRSRSSVSRSASPVSHSTRN